MTQQNVCRWGILSTAEIGRKNWKAIRLAGNAVVTAVASRTREAAQRFIQQCQQEALFDPPPVALESYDALLELPQVDAVYIPLPTGLRKPWVIRAAEAGKHVLAEKPAAVCYEDLQEMIAACQRNSVQYMDGVMFMHSARLELLRRALDEGHIGDIRRITTQFTFSAPEKFERTNIRAHSALEPHGCLGDLGWYNVRIILWLMGGRLPQRVCGRLLDTMQHPESPRPVPAGFSGELWFDGGVTASFYCSFLAENQQWVHVSGRRGCLRIPDFVLPRYSGEVEFFVDQDVYEIDGCNFRMLRREKRWAVAEYDAGARNAQETRMIRTFSDLVLRKQPDLTWPAWTLSTQRVLDACWKSAQSDGTIVTL